VLPSGPWQNLGIPWEKALIFTTSWWNGDEMLMKWWWNGNEKANVKLVKSPKLKNRGQHHWRLGTQFCGCPCPELAFEVDTNHWKAFSQNKPSHSSTANLRLQLHDLLCCRRAALKKFTCQDSQLWHQVLDETTQQQTRQSSWYFFHIRKKWGVHISTTTISLPFHHHFTAISDVQTPQFWGKIRGTHRFCPWINASMSEKVGRMS
jgi:hypothetical protein